MNLYIADTHFGHKNILLHDHRPFSDTEEMWAVMKELWNNRVDKKDDVWIIGDFCFWGATEDPIKYLRELKGKKHLIVGNHDKRFLKNEKAIQSFSLPEKGIEYVIYSGKTFEADSAYADIYSKAKRKIFIVDNYIGPKTLLMLKSVPANVDIIVFSDNIRNMLRLSELQSFQNEYPNVRLSFQKTGGKFHDRYIVIDYKTQSEKIYHCGASSKDAGNKITTISKSDNKELYHPMVDDLLLQPVLQLR